MPRRGGKWDDHVADATEACNARPHETVHAAPDNVETQSAIQFRVLPDNAQKFQHQPGSDGGASDAAAAVQVRSGQEPGRL